MARDGNEVGPLAGVVSLDTGGGVGDGLRHHFGCKQKKNCQFIHFSEVELSLIWTFRRWLKSLTHGDGRGGDSCGMGGVRGHRHGDYGAAGHLCVWHRAWKRNRSRNTCM